MHISRVSQCFTVITAWEARVIAIIRRPHRQPIITLPVFALPIISAFQGIPTSNALSGSTSLTQQLTQDGDNVIKWSHQVELSSTKRWFAPYFPSRTYSFWITLRPIPVSLSICRTDRSQSRNRRKASFLLFLGRLAIEFGR